MLADIASRFTEILMTDCAAGERSRYLVGASCPKLAFFYTVGLEALGGEFENEEIKLFVNSFGTHVLFPFWEGCVSLADLADEQLREVEEALPPSSHLSHIFID